MILELDVGNTRIKWRQLRETDGTVLSSGAVTSVAELTGGEAARMAPAMIRLCSVRAAEAVREIKSWADANWGLDVMEARVTRSCAGVSNHYQDLTRLGVDRWLAMVAAFNRRPGGCLIVDSGTAVTVDVVAADGQHQGGYIVPGRALMCGALEAHTQIRLGPVPARLNTHPGHSTDEAVQHGVLAMQVALVEKALRRYLQDMPDLNLYLTGGDANLLAEQLQSAQQVAGLAGVTPEVIGGLVLDGLAYVCPGPGEA